MVRVQQNYITKSEANKNKSVKLILIHIIICLILLPSFSLIPNLDATAQGYYNSNPLDDTSVLIALKDPYQNIKVNETGHATVVFSGTVSVQFPKSYPRPPSIINVTLTTHDNWNSSMVSPKHIIFQEDGEKPFNVTVFVNYFQNFDQYGNLIVSGRWESDSVGLWGDAEPNEGAKGRIDIIDFYKFSISFNEHEHECAPNGDHTFYLTITNQGSCLDFYEILCNKDQKFFSENNVMQCEFRRVDIRANETKKIGIKVFINDRLTNLDEYKLNFKVVSERNSNVTTNAKEAEIKISVPDKYFYLTGDFYNIVLITIILVVVIIIARKAIVKRDKPGHGKDKAKNRKKIKNDE